MRGKLQRHEKWVTELATWEKPFGRDRVNGSPYLRDQMANNGFLVLNSTAEHKACLDCEHIRVGGMPNRACVKRPYVHLWFTNADDEVRNYSQTGDVTTYDGVEVITEHPGQTMADVCPHFQLDSFYDGKPTRYFTIEEEPCEDN